VALALAICTLMMYNRCMKKRTNMYFNEDDKAYIAFIKEHYNLTSDAAAVRLAIKRVAEEIKRSVPGTQSAHRKDRTARRTGP
jgi:hypothetical protein